MFIARKIEYESGKISAVDSFKLTFNKPASILKILHTVY